MNYPEQLHYTKDHGWIRFENEEAYIGITDFAQKELSDIVDVTVGKLFETVDREKMFGTIESLKACSDLFMPVTGIVLEVNRAIIITPELINKDPYGSRWLIRIDVLHDYEKVKLLSAAEYTKWIAFKNQNRKV